MVKKMKRKMVHSRERKKNHVIIIADFENEKNAKEFAKEMRKVARKTRHLYQNGFSYEMYSI